MSFRRFQSEQTPFWLLKTSNPKSRKMTIFPKGLTHGFDQKMAIFQSFFFQEIQARKMSFAIFQSEKTPFQAKKRGSSKSRKIDIFPKGLTHGFGRKMAIFPTFFFQEIWARKMSFAIFQSDKTRFSATKTRSPKSRKIGIFPKGLAHGFGPKMAIFPACFFRKYRPEKCPLRYSRATKRVSRLQKREVQKVEKLGFFQRGQPMVLVQKWPFFQLVFLGNIGQKNVLYDILEWKNAFLGYKNKKFKKWKN